MNLRERYENLLKEMCKACDTMLQLIKKIAEYDIIIYANSDNSREGTDTVVAAISQKERYIEQFSDVSIEVENYHAQLENIMAICLEVQTNPLYYVMCDMRMLVNERLNILLQCEDGTCDEVLESLETCKASYELDIALSKIPNELKSTFMMIPNKKR